jgi:single-strand DNA-binding protein
MKTKNVAVKEKAVKSITDDASKTKSENKFRPKNIVILTGNLGKDPQVQELKSGRKKAFFTMATNSVFTNKNSGKEEVLWHSLVAWGKLAEKVEASIKSGDRVSVTGRIHNRSYTDKNGVNKIFTEIVLRSLDIVRKKEAVSVV